MKLSAMITKLEEYLDVFANDYSINSIVIDANYKYKVNISEDGEFYPLFIDENGEFYNVDGNLLEIAKDAYDNDKDILYWIERFEEKWRIK